MTRTAILILLTCGVPAGASAADAVELVAVGDKPARIELTVEVDGRPLTNVWDDTFAKMFAFYDRDGDGVLSEAEAARLPSAFALRQLLWGQTAAHSGAAIPWPALDADRDGRVTRAEMADAYRRAGVGTVVVGTGQPPGPERLTAALVAALDANGDGKVSEEELKAAPSALQKFDLNDDELVGPGELVPKLAYPGARGTNVLLPPRAGVTPVPEVGRLPLVLLPTGTADTAWSEVVSKRLGGKPAAPDLVAWRREGPAVRWKVQLGAGPVVREPFVSGRLRVEMRAEAGTLPVALAASRKQTLGRFADTDADANGVLVEKEVVRRNHQEIKSLYTVADRNADGKLTREEASAWLDLQDRIASGQVLLTVLDYGAGLFELLDADRDGSLSVPELRTAWNRASAAGCVTAGVLDTAKLPRQLSLAVSRGHPESPLGGRVRGGPDWFKAMDRNRDGCVSRREFTGGEGVFDRLDLDKDGLLSPEEASKAEVKK